MADPTGRPASVREVMAHFQREAYLSAGVHPAELIGRFNRYRERIETFQQRHPDYLPGKDELLQADPDLDFVELDFARRCDTPGWSPFQDPWSLAILNDYWSYHRKKLYRDDPFDLALGTMATRSYNAHSFAGDGEYGILIGEGLLRLAQVACGELAPLLYTRAGAGYLPREAADVFESAQPAEATAGLLEAIRSWHAGDLVVLPAPVIRRESDFAIRHVLFSGFMAFVLEHELYHLRVAKNGGDEAGLEAAFERAWQFFDGELRTKLPAIPERAELERLLRAHREEIQADLSAVSRVMLLGKVENCVGAMLSGALLFFYLTETIRAAQLMEEDAELLASQENAGGEFLATSALYFRESHPYPQSRRASVLSLLARIAPHYQDDLTREDRRLQIVFARIRGAMSSRP